MSMTVRARVIFHGHVQGVYFRANCADKARELGLEGFVRNLPEGTVEAVFEGDEATIRECIEWNKTSQPHAEVSDVEVAWGEPEGGFKGFHVWR